MIVKRSDGYHVVSESGKNLGGPYGSREQAQSRLNQVERFKHMNKSEIVNFVILKKARTLGSQDIKVRKKRKSKNYVPPIKESFKRLKFGPSHWKRDDELDKSQVMPFYRYKKGRIERVKGWLMPERYNRTEYEPSTKGVMSFIQDHMSLEDYGKLLQRAAKESTYMMEAVNSAYLDVANSAKGTLEKLAKVNMPSLKSFLGTLFNQVQEDVLSIRKDFRKSLRKSKK